MDAPKRYPRVHLRRRHQNALARGPKTRHAPYDLTPVASDQLHVSLWSAPRRIRVRPCKNTPCKRPPFMFLHHNKPLQTALTDIQLSCGSQHSPQQNVTSWFRTGPTLWGWWMPPYMELEGSSWGKDRRAPPLSSRWNGPRT